MSQFIKHFGLAQIEDKGKLGSSLGLAVSAVSPTSTKHHSEFFFEQNEDEIFASITKTVRIRMANESDIPAIQKLLQPYVDSSVVLPRSEAQIRKDLKETYIGYTASIVAAVMNFTFFDENLCEIRGLVVDPYFQKSKIGSRLIQHALADLRKRHPQAMRVFALTYVPDFFIKLGFKLSVKENFPQKIYEVCQYCAKKDDCKEIAVELSYP